MALKLIEDQTLIPHKISQYVVETKSLNPFMTEAVIK